MDKVAENISKFIDGAISVSVEEMLIQVLATLLLFLVIRFYFWNHITDYLDGRKKAMASELEEAEKANLVAQELKVSAESELNEVRLGAKGIIDEAKGRGEKERTAIVSKAKDEAKKVMENAKKEIDSEIEKAREGINDEIVNVAVLMAEKVIKKEIDSKKYESMIDEVAKEVAN
jgi:F-type H+-transporting ATPase subunit b